MFFLKSWLGDFWPGFNRFGPGFRLLVSGQRAARRASHGQRVPWKASDDCWFLPLLLSFCECDLSPPTEKAEAAANS